METSIERPGARWWVPEDLTLRTLGDGVQECRGCELYREATQGVVGAGDPDAELLVLGEQPGDREDRAGKPFVGPAGQLLDRALGEAGIDPGAVFRTNVVKHFRFVRARSSQRLHRSPGRVHVAACGPWLLAELDVVRPTGVLVLGATAGQALYGTRFRVGTARGELRDWPDDFGGHEREGHHRPEWVLATAHPASVLRARRRDEEYALLVEDLRVAAAALTH